MKTDEFNIKPLVNTDENDNENVNEKLNVSSLSSSGSGILSFDDDSPLKMIVIICLVVLLLVLGSFAVWRNVRMGDNINENTPVLSQEDLVNMTTDEIMEYLKEYIKGLDLGGSLEISDDEWEAVETKVANSLTKKLSETDLLNLTDAEKDKLISEMTKEILDNLLKDLNILDYLSDSDYKTIAEKIASITNSTIMKELSYLKTEISTLSETIEENQQSTDERITRVEKDVETLLEKIQEEAAARQEADEALGQSIDALRDLLLNTLGVDKFVSGTSYPSGAYVIANNKLYVSLKDSNTSDVSNTSAWQETDVMTMFDNTRTLIANMMGATYWNNKTTYQEGDLVFFGLDMYRSKVDANTVLPTTASAWEPMSIAKMFDSLMDSISNEIGAEEWNPDKPYSKGKYVVYNKKIYVSTVNNNISEPGKSDTWEETDILGMLTDLDASITKKINDLAIRSASSLDQTKDALIAMVNSNAKLSEEARQRLLDEINGLSDTTNTSLQTLYNNLMKTINDNEELNEEDKDAIRQSITNLSDSTNTTINGVIQKQEYDDATIWSHLKDKNGSDETFQYGYDSESGAYGYYVNGVFKPF